MSVLAVVINYNRPTNIPLVVGALYRQSVPCKIVVVDNHPEDRPEWSLPQGIGGLDDVWRWSVNAGPACRFAPALARTDCEWTWFVDDDLAPGPEALAHLLDTADRLDGKFATLGQFGRRFRILAVRHYHRTSYLARNLPLTEKPYAADLTCRTHFCHTSQVPHAVAFRWDLLRVAQTAGDRLACEEDDFLLCLGIQRATGWPSYVVPAVNAATSQAAVELPSPQARHRRREHLRLRGRLIQVAMAIGWKPLTQGPSV